MVMPYKDICCITDMLLEDLYVVEKYMLFNIIFRLTNV